MLKFSTLLLLVGANLSFAAFDSINKVINQNTKIKLYFDIFHIVL